MSWSQPKQCDSTEFHDEHTWQQTTKDQYSAWPSKRDYYCRGLIDPAKIVSASVVTEWSCHACKADNDVWGEGAVGTWMQCGECGEESYLSMDDVGTSVTQR